MLLVEDGWYCEKTCKANVSFNTRWPSHCLTIRAQPSHIYAHTTDNAALLWETGTFKICWIEEMGAQDLYSVSVFSKNNLSLKQCDSYRAHNKIYMNSRI